MFHFVVNLGSAASSSNQQSYYPYLKGPYSQGFTLVQFLAIPGATNMAGLAGHGVKMKYEAIYSKRER